MIDDELDLYSEEERAAAKEFYDRMGAEIKKISDSEHGKVTTPEEAGARAAFWLKVIHEQWPEMVPMVALILDRLELRAHVVPSVPEGGYVN